MLRAHSIAILSLALMAIYPSLAFAQGTAAGGGGVQTTNTGPVQFGNQGGGVGVGDAQGTLLTTAVSGSGQVSGDERFYRPPTIQRTLGSFVGADVTDISNGYGHSSSIAMYGGTGLVVGAGAGGARGINTLGVGGQAGGQGGGGIGGQAGGFGGQGGGLGGLTTALGGFGGQQGGLLGGQRGGGFGGQAGQPGVAGVGVASQAQPVRAAMVVGFNVPVVASRTPIQLSSRLERQFAQALQIQSRTPVRVEMTGRTVVLRGIVETAHARDLAERLALLEPGVSSVQNELTVSPAATPQN